MVTRSRPLHASPRYAGIAIFFLLIGREEEELVLPAVSMQLKVERVDPSRQRESERFKAAWGQAAPPFRDLSVELDGTSIAWIRLSRKPLVESPIFRAVVGEMVLESGIHFLVLLSILSPQLHCSG
jgi:hypothetical protein